MTHVKRFLNISIVLIGILFSSKNANGQCTNFNVTLSQISDGPSTNDAAIEATVTGGSGKIMYSWSNNSYGPKTLSNIGAGYYSVYVYDSLFSCTDSANIIVTDTFVLNAIPVVSFEKINFPYLDSTNTLGCINDTIVTAFHFAKTAGKLSSYLDWGDGSPITIDNYSYTSTGDKKQYSHLYNTTGSYTVTVNFKDTTNTIIKTISKSISITNCVSISGSVYNDGNNDCIMQGSENKLSNQQLYLYKNGRYAKSTFTDANGYYSFNSVFPNSQYEIDVNGSEPLNCSNVNNNISVQTLNANITQNIGLKDSFYITNKFFNFGDTTLNCQSDSTRGYLYFIKSTGAVTTKIFFGNGDSSVFLFNNSSNTVYTNFKYKYNSPGTYMIKIVYISNGLVKDSLIDSIVISNCGNLNGKVYVDNNKNCTYETTDLDAQYYLVKLIDPSTNQTIKTTYTNQIGTYEFKVPNNTAYKLQVMDVINCNSNLRTFSIPAFASTYTKDIPLNPDSINYTVHHFQLGSTRPNKYLSIYFSSSGIYNGGNRQYKITIPSSKVTLTGASNAYTKTGNVVSITSSNSYNYITLWIDSLITINDTFCFTVELLPVNGESYLADNISSFCIPGMVSYDPNDKQVAIQSMGNDGNFTNATDEFTYTVRFQNVGSAPAGRVYIKDLIDQKLDINTLRIINTSHKAEINVNENRELFVNFPNIELPSNKVDEKGSNGFVVYAIKPIANLPLNSTIQNTANIFFDWNSPIITNTTANKLVVRGSNSVGAISKDQSFIVYPNPVSETLYIKSIHSTKPSNDQSVEIYSANGQMIYSAPKTEKIDVTTYPKGMYFIKLSDGEQVQTEKFIKQ